MAARKGRRTDPRPRRCRAWDRYLREHGLSRLIVPEDGIEPLVGAILWSPDDELPPRGGPCPTCRDAIPQDPHDPSRSYCPKCGLSGFERPLHEQRIVGPPPPPDPKPRGPLTVDKSKTQRGRGRPRKIKSAA